MSLLKGFLAIVLALLSFRTLDKVLWQQLQWDFCLLVFVGTRVTEKSRPMTPTACRHAWHFSQRSGQNCLASFVPICSGLLSQFGAHKRWRCFVARFCLLNSTWCACVDRDWKCSTTRMRRTRTFSTAQPVVLGTAWSNLDKLGCFSVHRG